MTDVLITIDTELSPALHQRSLHPSANIRSSILGGVQAGMFGIDWQMTRMEAHGLKGVFFVDPMAALVYGESFLPGIVQPILSRGHEIQLHIHTEWLSWAEASPVGDRQGQNIGDFEAEDQETLLRCALDLLERAGAPRPIAFRAGNFGADDRTLAALARLGIAWDTSFNAFYLGRQCRIDLPAETTAPLPHCGITELPVAGLFDLPGHVRPAQVCALSSWEMKAALRHAVRQHQPAFAIVTHSFEMLSRDRCRPNRAVMTRFESMCREIAGNSGLRSVGFADLDPAVAAKRNPCIPRLGANIVRTAARLAEQTVATWLYERRLLPA